MSKKQETPEVKTIRCAIYTRKSTEEGLQQEFNSLDAQREASEAFIASQKAEGWRCLPQMYDDGGFSGGNLERPAMKRLMDDIEAGKIDCVVVYKVDRLSRSLMDFSRVMETFDKFGVSFVSVTQQFNTTHSMGRLTLNILLSFAQFEREIIGERIRDKIAAMRAKGKWSGGMPVLGYDVDRSGPSRKLATADQIQATLTPSQAIHSPNQIPLRNQPAHLTAIPKASRVSKGAPNPRVIRSARRHPTRTATRAATVKALPGRAVQATRDQPALAIADRRPVATADRVPIHDRPVHPTPRAIRAATIPPACPHHRVALVQNPRRDRGAIQAPKVPTVIGLATVTTRASVIHLEATATRHPKAMIPLPIPTIQVTAATVLIGPAKVHPTAATVPIGRAKATQPTNPPKTAADRVNPATAPGFGRAVGNWLTAIAKTLAIRRVRPVHSMAR